MKTPSLKKDTKKGLEKIRKNGGFHYFRNSRRIVKYGFLGFARNVWLTIASILVTTITLFILFLTGVVTIVLNDTATAMRDKIDITIYLQPGTTDEELARLEEIISADSNVKSVETSSSEDEYELFLSEYADDEDIMSIVADDGDDDMRDAIIANMQATMRVKVYNVENLESVRDTVENDVEFSRFVDTSKEPTYDASRAEIARIVNWANIAKNAGIVLSAVFVFISILIVFNTIRMSIFSRREEIHMMKLVGADKNFIRGPFTIEAEISGVISGMLAAFAGYGAFKFLSVRLEDWGIDVSTISNILDSNWSVLVLAAFAFLGAFIGAISARLATKKYLHKS